ncbi:hypothetical protein ABPG75_002318 [Micractinium tetrahymenae]
MAATLARWRCAVQVAACARQLSTAPPPPGELPSLKAALRAVYKRDANTRSFKMLHEYLEAARTGPRVPVPYRFHFFVRTGEGSGDDDDSSAAPGAAAEGRAPPAGDPAAPAAGLPPGLREVTVMLPPPTRGAPGEALSGSARKAFGTLLAALGLPSRIGSDGDAGQEADQFSRFVNLREFLPQAVETVHQYAAAQSGAQHQLGALRTALRLGRRIAAGFGGGAAAAGALRQLSLLRRLVAALDALPQSVDLAGLKITIGDSSGVDGLGTVWLDAEASQAAWERQLAGVDAEHCRRQQALRQQVKAQEAAVASALGLAMLYTQQEASLSSDYRQALERLASAAAGRGPVGSGRFRELPVMLQPAGEGQHGGSGAASAGGGGSSSTSSKSSSSAGSRDGRVEGCAVDPTAGLLLAPVDVTAEALYAAIERLGPQVLAAAAQRRRREAELAALRQQVERKVMLRRLVRDPAISDARFKSCLDRMLGSAQKLSGLLHGQSVRVAEVNGLSPDRAVIDIAWNWQL